MKTATTIVIAAVAMIIAASVDAQPPIGASARQPQRSHVSVSYADLNLAAAAGQKTFAQRIDAAAANACGVNAVDRDLNRKRAANACHHAAVAKATLVIASANGQVYASR